MENLFGYTDEEFTSRKITFFECIHDDDKQRVLESLTDIENTDQKRYEFEPYRIQTKDNKIIWVQDITNIIRDEKNKVVFYYCYMTDITKQKEINNKLEEQKNLVETIINTIPDIVWMKDKSGVFLHCNNKISDFFGLPKDEIIGKTDYDLVDKELADFFVEHDKRAMNSNVPLMNYEVIPYADGHEEYTQTIKSVLKDNDGNIIGTIGIGRDLTHELSQKDELEKSKKTLSEYVIYVRTNLSGIISEVSEAFCIVSGYTQEELKGRRHQSLRSEDMPKGLYKNILKTIQSKKVWQGEIKNIKKDGSYYWVNATISPDYDNNQELIGYISINTEITAKKDFEQQHEQLLEQTKMASLGEMLGNISHQWRQPLNAISMSASSLQLQSEIDLLDKEELKKTTDMIIKQSEYLSETINTFTNFIRKDKKVSKITIQNEVSKALSIIESTLKTNFIKLNMEIEKSPIYVNTISGELSQAIINILNNSKDILLEKDINNPFINLKLLKEDKEIVLSIEDNAGGIDNEIMAHIFEPYFTTKHKSIGTGLGLYISYKIVTESLGANLYASNTKKGAKFKIVIPLKYVTF